MPRAAVDFGAIYDRVIESNPGYNSPAGSPGYRACLQNAARLAAVNGPALDVGCGVGYAVELLRGPQFGLDAWGVDVSRVAMDRAREHLGLACVRRMEPGVIPFDGGAFGLVTCFDVLEHLDEPDVDELIGEMRRVRRPGGSWLVTVSCRPSVSVDHHGDNLHRTVRAPDWWAARIEPDEYTVSPATMDVCLWTHDRDRASPMTRA